LIYSCNPCLTSTTLETRQRRVGPLKLSCGAATIAKFGPHVGNNKFNTQNEECICVVSM